MISKSSLVKVARWTAIIVVSLLCIWQCVLLRVAGVHGQLSYVPTVLLHAVRSWAAKEGVSVDQIRDVDSEFLDILFGNSLNLHSYVVGFDKTLIINSRQHFRIMIDGDGDGFFMSTIPLSDKVALITEAIPTVEKVSERKSGILSDPGQD
jgi:hypothetical protein